MSNNSNLGTPNNQKETTNNFNVKGVLIGLLVGYLVFKPKKTKI